MAATFTEDVDIKRILDTLANAKTKLTAGKVQILTDEKNEQLKVAQKYYEQSKRGRGVR